LGNGNRVSFRYDGSQQNIKYGSDNKNLRFDTTDAGLEIKMMLNSQIDINNLPAGTQDPNNTNVTNYNVNIDGIHVQISYNSGTGQYNIPGSDPEKFNIDQVDNILTISGDYLLGTVGTDILSSPNQENILYYTDGIFTYNKNDNNYTRRAPYMIMQPGLSREQLGSVEGGIFELPTPYFLTIENTEFKITHMSIDDGLILLSWDKNNNEWTAFYNYALPVEGNESKGAWLGEYGVFSDAIIQLDQYARAHTFEETWKTMSQYGINKNNLISIIEIDENGNKAEHNPRLVGTEL